MPKSIWKLKSQQLLRLCSMNSYLIVNTTILKERRFKIINSRPPQSQAQLLILYSLNLLKVWKFYIINTQHSVKKNYCTKQMCGFAKLYQTLHLLFKFFF